jgi:hypothetical protein
MHYTIRPYGAVVNEAWEAYVTSVVDINGTYYPLCDLNGSRMSQL